MTDPVAQTNADVSKPARPPRRLRKRYIFGTLMVLLTAGVAAAYLASDTLIHWQVERRLAQQFGAQVHIGELDMDFWRGRVIMHDIAVTPISDHPDIVWDQPALFIETLDSHLNFSAWWSEAPLLTQVEATRPTLHLIEHVDAQRYNVIDFKYRGERDAQPATALPTLFLHESIIRVSQIIDGRIEQLTEVPVSGQLKIADDQPQLYEFELRETDAEADASEPLRLSGSIDLHHQSVNANLHGLRFDDRFEASSPSRVRKWWKLLNPRGQLEKVELTFDPHQGLVIVVDLADGQILLPQFTEENYRFEPHISSGRFRLTPQSIEVIDLISEVEDINYRINGEFYGYSADVPFKLFLETQPFNIPRQPRYMLALPEPVQKMFSFFDPQGTLSVSMLVERTDKTTGQHAWDYQGTARILSGSGHYFRFPYPLHDCNGLIRFSRNHVEIDSLTGRLAGGGSMKLSGQIENPGDSAIVDLQLVAIDVPLNDTLWNAIGPKTTRFAHRLFDRDIYQRWLAEGRLVSSDLHRSQEQRIEALTAQLQQVSLPEQQRMEKEIERLRQELRKPIFDIGGTINANVQLSTDGTPGQMVRFSAEVDAADVGMVMRDFAYPLQVDRARLDLDGSTVKLKSASLRGLQQGHAEVRGVIGPADENDQRVMRLHYDAHDFILDQHMYQAMPSRTAKLMREMALRGVIDVYGDLTIADGHGESDLTWSIREGAIELVPEVECRIIEAEGTVADDQFSIEFGKLGYGPGTAELSGFVKWNGDTGPPDFALSGTLADLKIDADLIDSLKRWYPQIEDFTPTLRRVGLEAICDGRWVVTDEADLPTDYALELFPKMIHVTPDEQQLVFEHLSGSVAFTQSQATWQDLAGRCEDWAFRTTGGYRWDEQSTPPAFDSIEQMPQTRPNILSMSLWADGQLQRGGLFAMMPQRLRKLIDTLNLTIAQSGHCELALNQIDVHKTEQGMRLDHLAGRIRLNNAGFNLGIPVRQFFGTLDLNWKQDAQQRWPNAQIGITAERMMITDREVTEFQGQLVADGESDEWVISPFHAQAYQGTATGHAAFGSADADYRVHLTIADVDLPAWLAAEPDHANGNEDAAQHHGEASHNITKGKLNASLDLRGSYGSRQREGRGMIVIREAELYRLPLALGLLQMTHLSLPTEQSFDTSQINYTIQGERVVFDRLTLSSPQLRLGGSGTMNLKTRSLDLTLISDNPQRLDLGGITDILDGIRNELITIEVTGTVDDPRYQVEQFTGLSRAFDEIFNLDAQP